MASQVQISSYQAICGGGSSEALPAARRIAPDSRQHLAEAGLPAIIAHSFEFVALPGRAEGIQSEIPIATRFAVRTASWVRWCWYLNRKRVWSPSSLFGPDRIARNCAASPKSACSGGLHPTSIVGFAPAGSHPSSQLLTASWRIRTRSQNCLFKALLLRCSRNIFIRNYRK